VNDKTVVMSPEDLRKILAFIAPLFDAERTVDYTADELDALWDEGGAE
jgi:hypothetical protein